LLLFNPSIEAFIAVGLIVLVAFPIHEFAHAMAAYQLGDSTARLFGRLTIDPRAHIDPLGAILLLLAGFGWAKPTPVNPFNLRGGRSGEALVAFAGPASNLILATAGALPLRYIFTSRMDVPDIIVNTLVLFVSLNLLLMVFNLIPIPPLDGSKVLFAALDQQTEYRIRPVLEQYGFIILIAAVFLPILPGGQTVVGAVVGEVLDPIYQLLVGQPRFLLR
jgi:Zn-dependent protease